MVVLAVLIAACGFAGLWAATPAVADAPARVDAILDAHHAPSDRGAIPRKVSMALLATEDSRYWHDPALDPQGTARAIWGMLTGNPNEGGATIEVQLAKVLYTPGRSNPPALLEQVGIAFKLDHRYTKKQILAMYLDAVYFGDGAYGVVEAAERYFGRRPGQLTWAQASLLGGLVQAPSDYTPRYHLHAALIRRRHVLDRLVATGVLTPARADRISRQPLDPAVPFTG